MKKTKDKNGFTLIEVIVSMLIISIIAVAFISFFGGGITNIINMGKKSKANVRIQTLADRIYESSMTIDAKTFVNFDEVTAAVKIKTNTVLNAEVGTGGFEELTYANFENPYITGTSKDVRYCITSITLLKETAYPLVKLRLYYNDGRNSVTVTIPIIKQKGV